MTDQVTVTAEVPGPPPIEIRYPAVMHKLWWQLVIATVGGASLGFGAFSLAFHPTSPFAWISISVGAGTAVMNLIVGPKQAGRFAFFCGQMDGIYRLFTKDWASLGEEPTYPEEEVADEEG
jgi:hypothetical protein